MGGREVSRPYRIVFFAEGERFLSFWRCHRPRKRAALVMWCGWFKPRLEIRHATALTTGAKHWHRQKAVFYVFCFGAPSIYPLNRKNRYLKGAIKNKKPKLLFELEPGQLFRLELIQHLFWRVQCHHHSVGVDEQWSKSFVLFPRFHQLGTSLVACVELWVCVQTIELANLIP